MGSYDPEPKGKGVERVVREVRLFASSRLAVRPRFIDVKDDLMLVLGILCLGMALGLVVGVFVNLFTCGA